MKLSSLTLPDCILQDSSTIQCVFQVSTTCNLNMRKLQSPYFCLSILVLNFHKNKTSQTFSCILWATMNNMLLNSRKTKGMICGSSEPDLQQMNEWCLKRVSKFKLLGVWQQDNLHVCWNYHVEQTVKKASERFYCTNAFVLMLLVCDSPRYKLTATDTKKTAVFPLDRNIDSRNRM